MTTYRWATICWGLTVGSGIVFGVHRLGITLFSPHCVLSGTILTPSDLLIYVWHGKAAMLTTILPMSSDVWHGLIPTVTPWQRGPNRMMPEVSFVNMQNKYKDADTQRHDAFETSLHLGWKVHTERSQMFGSVSPGLRGHLNTTLITLFSECQPKMELLLNFKVFYWYTQCQWCPYLAIIFNHRP